MPRIIQFKGVNKNYSLSQHLKLIGKRNYGLIISNLANFKGDLISLPDLNEYWYISSMAIVKCNHIFETISQRTHLKQ